MVDTNQVPVVVNSGKSLLKTRLLDGEKIVAEFAETPVCNSFCREGRIRRIQLTNRRINYYETYRKNCCFKTAPLLRQVFLKDVCEVAVDNYGQVAESWAKQLFNFLMLFVAPAAGIALLVLGIDDNTGFLAGGGALLGIWVLFVICRLCRKPSPEIVFGTRCPQFSAFSIRLTDKASRIQLLEEVTTLLSKNQ